MILRGVTPRRLSWGGGLMLFGLGAMLLPIVPTFAQDNRPGDRREERREERGERREGQPGPQDLDRARQEVEKLKHELAERMARVREAEEKLRDAAARLGRMEGRPGEKREVRVIIIRTGERSGTGRDEQRDIVIVRPDERWEDVLRRLGDLKGGGIRIERFQNERSQPNQPGPRDPRVQPPGGGARTGPMPPPGRGPSPRSYPGTAPGAPPPRENDQRLRNLEQRLDEVLKQLEEMRRQMRGPRPGPERETEKKNIESELRRRGSGR